MQEIQFPVEFTNNGRTFIYDIDRIDVEQAELCKELGEFKKSQLDAQPNTFKEVMKSGGADFMKLAISFLLLEKKDGKILEFNRDKADTDVFNFVKKLPMKQLEIIRLCVENFFLNINQEYLLSEIFQKNKSKNTRNDIILSKMLDWLMNQKLSKDL